jgi:GrpB-like predicted nucleotidyltransferase (UPF0157 family)
MFGYEAGTGKPAIDIDLLPPELQSLTTMVEDDDLHAQYIVVKTTGYFDISYGEDKVVEPVYLHF